MHKEEPNMQKIINNKIYDTDRAEPLKSFRIECESAYTKGTVYAERDGSGHYHSHFIYHECMHEGVLYHSILPIAKNGEDDNVKYFLENGSSQKVTIVLDDLGIPDICFQ